MIDEKAIGKFGERILIAPSEFRWKMAIVIRGDRSGIKLVDQASSDFSISAIFKVFVVYPRFVDDQLYA